MPTAAVPGFMPCSRSARTPLETAASLDAERARGQLRGPLHGIPVLVKDNIDTSGPEGTTAGSLALALTRPVTDAVVVSRLRKAGAVVIAKTNLSEWANFRARRSSSGWSAAGGQCRNPHALNRSPGGSSSGSGAGVAAGLAFGAVGTETDGSILCPAAMNGVVGIKPTVGLTSRTGVIPISASQDTVGPLARCVADAAVLLGVLSAGPAGNDRLDPATARRPTGLPDEYARFCRGDGLEGVRIGVPRDRYFGYSEKADALVEAVFEQARAAWGDSGRPCERHDGRSTRQERRRVHRASPRVQGRRRGLPREQGRRSTDSRGLWPISSPSTRSTLETSFCTSVRTSSSPPVP